MPRKEGQFLVEDFYLNQGGLNTADSPFVVEPNQAAGGQNFDYVRRGGVQKRGGHTRLNSSATTELRSVGLGLWDKPGSTRKVIRASGTKLQDFDFSAYTFTNLTEDTTAAGAAFLDNTSLVPYCTTMFNTAASGVLWGAGKGATSIWGVYSGTKVTANGVVAPTASAFTAVSGGAAGTLATGTYFYTLVYRKLSTQALSNGVLEVSCAVTLGQNVTLAWTLTNNDTTKYDKIYVYRSSVGGVTGFTAGALVTILASSATGYVDTGAVVSSSESVPRANSTVLDNSQVTSGTYETIALFKRRLAVAIGSTVYFSDINKSESWPTYQSITVPSGGKITALAVISIASAATSEIQEVLCVFKQRELWVISGDGVLNASNLPNWQLTFIDNSGCSGQALIASAGGFIAWVSYRGVFMWNGSGKPSYISQPIEDKFNSGGDIDKTKLSIGCAVYVQNRHEVQWYLSSKSLGEQKYVLKLDLRLTVGQFAADASQVPSVKGVFTPDVLTYPIYSVLSLVTAADAVEELLYQGDASGYMYSGYAGVADGTSSDITLQYITPYLTLSEPTLAKRISKIVVHVLDAGAFNLGLKMWSNYRYATTQGTSFSLAASQTPAGTSGIWDSGTWDAVLWDTNANQVRALTFNVTSTINDTEGDAFRLQFSQTGHTTRVLIYGFSVYYTQIATRH